MIKKYIGILTNNFRFKLLALAVAAVLWLVVMNVQNPIDTRTYPLLLQLQHMDVVTNNGYILQNESALKDRSVMVRVKASSKALAGLSQSSSDFRAYIDMKPIDISMTDALGQPMAVTVKVELPQYLTASLYEVTSVTPSTVDIVLDKTVEVAYPIVVDKNGDGAEGYVTMQPVVEPAEVVLKGSKTDMLNIDAVRVAVDLNTATEDVTRRVKPIVVNAAGKDISSLFTLSVDNVLVTVPVDKHDKIPISSPTFSGNVASGSIFEYATWEPEAVEVVGNVDEISSMRSISIPTINIDGRSETFIETVDLRQFFTETGLDIKNGTPTELTITVHIGREAVREISFPIASLNIEGMGRPFVLPEGNVLFTVKGAESAMWEMDVGALAPYINLAGLEVGVHELPVMLTLPDNITLVGERPAVSVEILEEEETDETEDPDETNETEEPEELLGSSAPP